MPEHSITHPSTTPGQTSTQVAPPPVPRLFPGPTWRYPDSTPNRNPPTPTLQQNIEPSTDCYIQTIANYQCEVRRLEPGEAVKTLSDGTVSSALTGGVVEAVWNCKPLMRQFLRCAGRPSVEVTGLHEKENEVHT
ncbi:hypothetical protein HDU78_000990 [Chytriomyces hyalinus]|nr:hypothetical protein HDU78_000990 [Chytriomyces hyalinus]